MSLDDSEHTVLYPRGYGYPTNPKKLNNQTQTASAVLFIPTLQQFIAFNYNLFSLRFEPGSTISALGILWSWGGDRSAVVCCEISLYCFSDPTNLAPVLANNAMSTLNLIAIRDGGASMTGDSNGGAFYSPAKEKAANRGVYNSRWPVLRRLRQAIGVAKVKLLLIAVLICVVVSFTSRISSFMGWNSDYATSSSSISFSTPGRGGYTVLINTWKRNTLLKQSVGHYASCRGTDAIHVVWSESEPPSASLRAYLKKTIIWKSQTAQKPNFRFDLNEEDNLNNRFKPIKDLRTDAVFSVDDDVIVPCDTLDFAFSVWQSAPSTMVGFVPRMLWFSEEKHGVSSYKYGGWWSVWWTGTYSMVLSKASFFHRNYLDMYTHTMPMSIRDYVTKERNCEDIAMSLLVANATGAPPIWVKGKIYEIGSFGISSLKDHNGKRNHCLKDFISLYGGLPLVSTHVKAVDAKHEWFW